MVVGAPLRIVYFGTPEFAVPTLERLIASRHQVIAVVSQPDRPKGRGQKLQPTPTRAAAERHHIPVLQPQRIRSGEFLASIASLRPDLGVVAAYGRILPDELLAIPRLGMINVHGSMLPAYRGAAPVHRAVIAGDAETGVTIMRVVRELDAGPMLAMRRRPIGPDETSADVERALAELGAPLLLDVVEDLAAGRATETAQDDALATYAPKIQRAEGAVDWSQPAAAIHNLVRGLQPWPLVSARMDGTRYLIHRTAVIDQPTAEPAGSIVAASGDRLDVAAGDGRVVRILQIQPEGKRIMTAREFLAGHKPRPGARFEPA
jgi:methionyl-tRNA formyltransferase